MNKFLLAGLILVILLPSAHSIALSFPNVGTIIFEPGKEITLEYMVQNSLPNELPVKATLSVGAELSDYVAISQHITKIPAQGNEKIYVTIKFPEELAYGMFSITFTVVEDSPVVGAFVAHVGATHTVKVLHPYPTGTPLIEFRGPNLLGASGLSNIQAAVRNIGNTDIQEKKVYAKLIQGNITAEAYSERITIPPLEEILVTVPFNIDVPPGMYMLQVGMTGVKDFTEIKMQVGNPTVKIDKIEKFSNEDQTIKLTVTNNWLQPLTEGTLALTIYPNKESKNGLFEAAATSITLQPGKNTLQLKIQKQKFLRDGIYPASLQVLTPPFYLGADGELEAKLTEIGKMLAEQTPKEQEAWQYEQVALDPTRVQATGKNKKLLALVLVVAIAMFLFSLAMIMRRRQDDEQADIHVQEPPKPS